MEGDRMPAHESQHRKAEAFRALHEGEPFLIPNPWDAGTAKVLAGLGFKALATTSAGFAFTLGRRDSDVTLDEVIDHVRVIDAATNLPVSVDLENGYGARPADAALAITRAAEAGAVGGSIEDYDAEHGIYELGHAVERISAASEAARGLGFPFMLTARAENFFRGNPDLEDTIGRLQAYEQAGADVLYAPFLANVDQIRAVCEATSKPVNVLARPQHSMSDVAGAGAQRVSVGSWLCMTATDALVETAVQMRERGDFSALRAPAQINEWLEA
jgi:2-methylisocitrate lyase-like PEP mutase family enzyme